LGFEGDGEQVLAHPFFSSFDLKKLEVKEVDAPFKPEISSD